VSDPLAPTFARIAAAATGDPAALAAGFLDLAPVFGADLAAHAGFRAAVTSRVVALFRDGVRATLAAQLAGR
jgi:fructuronate reductase